LVHTVNSGTSARGLRKELWRKFPPIPNLFPVISNFKENSISSNPFLGWVNKRVKGFPLVNWNPEGPKVQNLFKVPFPFKV